ncbi:hypothetical protein M6B38_399835 [Iris pallida]|uniref:Uncharacterized protein n=1 Tax=Iris pallida TaxID=29817 RepID=A0AAX6FV40_IRIPA|nr:hypothetical protein M6B38_399835 [Iris pallida]
MSTTSYIATALVQETLDDHRVPELRRTGPRSPTWPSHSISPPVTGRPAASSERRPAASGESRPPQKPSPLPRASGDPIRYAPSIVRPRHQHRGPRPSSSSPTGPTPPFCTGDPDPCHLQCSTATGDLLRGLHWPHRSERRRRPLDWLTGLSWTQRNYWFHPQGPQAS